LPRLGFARDIVQRSHYDKKWHIFSILAFFVGLIVALLSEGLFQYGAMNFNVISQKVSMIFYNILIFIKFIGLA